MKHRIFLWTLMILYLGFMIGWMLNTDLNQARFDKEVQQEIQQNKLNAQQESSKCNGCWLQAWNDSLDLEKRCHIIVEGLWSDEENKLTQLVFKDGEKEIIFGYCIYVKQKPGSVWDMDISHLITVWDKPSNEATLIARNIKDDVVTYECGFNRYYFKFKPRPKE